MRRIPDYESEIKKIKNEKQEVNDKDQDVAKKRQHRAQEIEKEEDNISGNLEEGLTDLEDPQCDKDGHSNAVPEEDDKISEDLEEGVTDLEDLREPSEVRRFEETREYVGELESQLSGESEVRHIEVCINPKKLEGVPTAKETI